MFQKVKELFYRLYARLFTRRYRVYLVRTGESLPPPLSPEEEQSCVRLSKTSEAARNRLIEHNLRLVVFIARKFENTGVQAEDLISIGTIGLIKAVNTFDPEKKIKLATYASRCIENEILMYLRRSCKLKLEVSLDEPLNVDWDGNELLLSDILGTDGEEVSRDLEDEVDRRLLWAALGRLNPRERRIVELRFGLGEQPPRTQKQVADAMGISQSYISRLEKRIMDHLKREILRMQG